MRIWDPDVCPGIPIALHSVVALKRLAAILLPILGATF